MYYFDAEYLNQYIDLGKDVVVTVDNEVLTLADMQSPKKGVGYNAAGESSTFDFMDIEQIQVGPNIITIDTLQKTMTGKEKEPVDSEPVPSNKPPKEEPADEPPPKDEKKPPVDKASVDIYMLGRQLIQESRKRR